MDITESNYARCIARIATRGSIGKEEARALLEEVSEAAERQRTSGVEDPIVTAAWQLSRDLKDFAANQKADVIANTAKRLERKTEIIAPFTAGGTGIKAAKQSIKALKSSLVWIEAQNKENVQSLRNWLSHNWRSVPLAKLDKAALTEAAADPQMFKSIAHEIWELRQGQVTVDPNASPARKIAQIIIESQEAQRARLNAEGARIGDPKDWIATTSHDVKLLRRGGRDLPPVANSDEAFQRWWSVVKDKLSDQTFADVGADPAAREEFGKAVFKALYDGVHLRTGLTQGPKFEPGGYNIARKLSQARTLYWKNGDAWAEYMAQYGASRDWFNLLMQSTDKNARQAALMHYWGTNPGASLDTVIRQVSEQLHRDNHLDAADAFKKQAGGAQNIMKELDGTHDLAENEMAAQIGRTARSVADMASLGAVQLTHASSLFGTTVAEAPYHGVSRLTGLGTMISSMFRNLSAADTRELNSQLGAFGDGMIRNNVDHFARGWSWSKDEGYMIPGMVSAAQGTYMKYTGLPYLFDHIKAGWKEMLANSYARYLSKGFDQLDAHARQMLQFYGVGADEWKLLQSGTLLKSNGKSYLTPDVVNTIDRNAIETLLRQRGTITSKMDAAAVGRAVTNFQTNLSDRLGMLYQDAADHVVVTPGAREQAMFGGAKTAWGRELQAAAMQFKSWPLAAVTQVYMRQIHESLTRNEMVWGMGAIIAATTLGGYLRSTIQDLASGLPPREPRNVGEAGNLGLYWFSRGGGLGIFGDMLFGELNRPTFGGTTALAGGPVLGMAASVINAFHDFMSLPAKTQFDAIKEERHFWTEYIKPLTGRIPYANLVYLRGAMNYLLLWHIYHAMNPDWWQRTNKALQKEQGRTYIGFRPYQPPPFSPF
jgi:hypothetical protein